MMKPLAVHFGAGALGRGLVIPFLCQSGYRVVAVDNDRALIDSLRQHGGYDILLTDTSEIQHIALADVAYARDERLDDWLKQASVITTSVRKENLHHVAARLKGIAPSSVICCENIEYSGDFFAAQMVQAGINPQGWHLPDCMVDRICAARWPDSLRVETESWGSVCVQALAGAVVPDKFETTPHIEHRFQEKRILVNTYADGIAFLGAAAGFHYLFEAAADERINAAISDYMQLMKRGLQLECGLDDAYLERMAQMHRRHLSNGAIKRDLASVARNFLEKIRPTERFIYPLIQLQQRGINIDAAIPFLNQLITSWASQQPDSAQACAQALKNIDNAEIVSKLGNAL
ncbi:mannitol dehydrogenase [Izhakiella australiensis]|nr:mannitol dehydrogenase [Izhakiella australiensis]